MGKNLTTSDIERQNILNNPFALQEIQKATHLKGLEYKGQFYLTYRAFNVKNKRIFNHEEALRASCNKRNTDDEQDKNTF